MNIYLHGSLNNRNFGDELLVILLARKIKAHIPNAKIYIKANEASYKEINSHIDVCRINRIFSFRKIDLIFFGGGGYFGGPSYMRSRWDISFFMRFLPIAIARKMFSINVVVYGVGVGPIPSYINRLVVKSLLNSSLSTFVRDSLSKDYIKSLGCNSGIVSDLVSNKLIFKGTQSIKIHKSIILHNVNSVKFMNEILRLMPNEYHIKIIYDSSKKFDHDECIETLKRKNIAYSIEPYVNTDMILEEIAASELVVTSKLHVGICATTLGVPTVAIPKHIKIHRYYEMMNLTQLCHANEIEAIENISSYLSFSSYIRDLKAKLDNRNNNYDNLESFNGVIKAIIDSRPN